MRKIEALRLMTSLTAVCAVACGYTDAGNGTQTLKVSAELSYHVEDNETHVQIAVMKNLDLLSGAQVILKDADSKEEFVIPEVNHPDQNHRDALPGHHRRMELSVVAGADNLTAAIEGPGEFTVPQPEHNRTIVLAELGDELAVKWRPDDGMPADEVSLRFERADYDTTLTEDQGHHEVKASYFSPGDENLRVERVNRVDLAGGTVGSVLTSGYLVRNDIVFQ